MSERPVRFLTAFDADAVYAAVCGHLAAAVADPAHPFRWPAVGTVAGGGPVLRTVVLRGFDPAGRSATFHTDARAPKVGQLRDNPAVALHFYDPDARLQMRLPAAATLHHRDAVAEVEWAAARDSSRAAYAEPHPPGTALPADAPVAAPPPVPADDRAAFDNFLVVRCHFAELEVLELHAGGNRRCLLAWPGGGLTLTRLAP